jgi:site-specific DNA-methyltransferase (adenine-specific)
MKVIDDKSIDLVLCYLPYGTTRCKWDTIIPFDPLWKHYERIIKDRGAIVLTASQPFTSALMMSNPKLFKYEWIWQKNQNSNFQNAKRQPLKMHESVLVFYKEAPSYDPQGVVKLEKPIVSRNDKSKRERTGLGHISVTTDTYETWVINYPKSVLKFNCERGLHPTQKPVALFEYLIKTYTNEGALVFDNCAGCGTTGVAALNTGRHFILMEKNEQYYQTILHRLQKHPLHNVEQI